MPGRRCFLICAAAFAATPVSSIFAQDNAGTTWLTQEQRLELRRRLLDAQTDEERVRLRREYLEQLRSQQAGQPEQTGGDAEAPAVEGLTAQEQEEMRSRLQNTETEEERKLIQQEYRDRAHLRGRGAQQSGGKGKGGSGQQGTRKKQDGTQPWLLPQGKRGGKD